MNPNESLFRVTPETLPAIWSQAFPMLEQALDMDGNKWSEETLYRALKEGYAQLWLIIEHGTVQMAFVTEMITYPLKKVVNLWLLSGVDIDAAMVVTPLIEGWARELGVDAIQAITRPGLARKFKTEGYETVREVIEKKLHKH